MTIYVESNFVLEIALGQPQAPDAEEIVARAEAGELSLAIPSFALSEPFSTITRRSRDLARYAEQLGTHLQRRAAWEAHRPDVDSVDLSQAFLARFGRREVESLTSIVERILDVATVIELDATVFRRAKQIRDLYGLDAADAMILASVVNHLNGDRTPGPHYFISRNSRDFGTPEIAIEFNTLACGYVRSFAEGALLLRQPLPE